MKHLGIALLATSALVLTPFPASTALAAGETCQGKAATIVGTGDKIVGTPGDDVIVTGSSTQVDAGAGHDLICLTSPVTEPRTPYIGAGEGNDLVDSTGTLRSAYVTLGDGRDRYVGGRADDRVSANDFDDTVTLGGGDDYFTAQDWRDGTPLIVGSYDGGSGEDWLTTESRDVALRLDLAEGRLDVDGVQAALVTGFTHAQVTAEHAVLKGDGRAQFLWVGGCTMEASGRGGNDHVAFHYSEDFEFKTCTRTARLSGGSGKDTLRGSSGDDVLRGNSGRGDSAHGRSGSDTCRAEKETTCER
ncbi:hypothetical protein DDE18_13165 [Nocardioides gansuensis]|uniref:Calcium-binding protein n=1 Tax=Nocardioides gansuensis TaxID=2138300 RepID=A0A2T8F9K3_9ACTN|nr:hypothetical protein [Nocardioides gansuensis]PVG82411.1 hypothetical protein DDE18_13165 [Nocardioides gansuensis]